MSSASEPTPTGWDAVAEQLYLAGVATLFGLPADDLQLLAALESRPMRMVLCRDQRNAVFMATGHALGTGLPGVCVVGKGPAVTNTVTGLLEARASAVPLLLIATGTPAARRDAGAFQELDQLSVVRPLVKWAVRVDDPGRLRAGVTRAMFVAANGVPGPVYLEIPEDLGAAPVPAGVVPVPQPLRHRPAPDPETITGAVAALRTAKRPLILVGGGARHRNPDGRIEQLAERLGAGIYATASGRGVVAEQHPQFMSLAGLYAAGPHAAAWRRTDLVVALGTRLEETATLGWPAQTRVLQVNVGEADVVPDRPGPVLLADVGHTVTALLDQLTGSAGDGQWRAELAAARNAAERAAAHRLAGCGDRPGVRVAEVLAELDQVLPAERVLVQENGLQDMWSYFYPYYRATPGGSVVPSEQTSLGFGAAAAVGVALALPHRPVVALVGDGAFGLFRSDLPTAREAGAGVLYLVLDNGGYGWLQSQLEQRAGEQSRFQFVRPVATLPAGPELSLAGDRDLFAVRVTERHQLADALRTAWSRCLTGEPAVVAVSVELTDVGPGIEELAGAAVPS